MINLIAFLTLCFSAVMHAEEDPVAIQAMLRSLENQQSADMSDRNLGDKEARIIASVLEKNPRVIALDLSMNNIGDEASALLGEALATNATLQSLDLSDNPQIGIKSAQAFLKALDKNKTLRTLKLKNTKISGSLLNNINKLLIRNKLLLGR
jgi:Ran GTPase-activating protein (RanGAP) involved in mRNA processing and transport